LVNRQYTLYNNNNNSSTRGGRERGRERDGRREREGERSEAARTDTK